MKSYLICAVAISSVCALSHSATVFNNTTTAANAVNELLSAGAVDSIEHGNQITLAGGERIVTSLSIRLRILGSGPATFNRQLRIYENDGSKGQPSTLLWESANQPTVIDSGADITYTFNVPSVRVPQSFTYTIQATNRQFNMAVLGPSHFGPPTVGSALAGVWRNPEGVWEFVNTTEQPFGARVEANGIPGDTNINGSVDVDDLLNVINSWGLCPAPCDADVAPVGGNGTVNVDDLLTVINNWG